MLPPAAEWRYQIGLLLTIHRTQEGKIVALPTSMMNRVISEGQLPYSPSHFWLDWFFRHCRNHAIEVYIQLPFTEW